MPSLKSMQMGITQVCSSHFWSGRESRGMIGSHSSSDCVLGASILSIKTGWITPFTPSPPFQPPSCSFNKVGRYLCSLSLSLSPGDLRLPIPRTRQTRMSGSRVGNHREAWLETSAVALTLEAPYAERSCSWHRSQGPCAKWLLRSPLRALSELARTAAREKMVNSLETPELLTWRCFDLPFWKTDYLHLWGWSDRIGQVASILLFELCMCSKPMLWHTLASVKTSSALPISMWQRATRNEWRNSVII